MKKLVILSGPTAAGKTALSINLAKKINGEIISADSMQVYKGMDIGTAKIKKDEMQEVPHHLIDIIEPSEEWNVSLFKEKTVEAMDGIYSRGHIPVIVGGTGFYIQSVLYDIDFSKEDGDMTLRKELEAYANEKGVNALHELLREKDPKSAEIIHANNVKRVIRALEYFEKNKKPISEHNEMERAKASPYNAAYFVLTRNRDRLYEGIDKRVDIMLDEGLLQEVSELQSKGYNRSYVSMQGLGYKEILDYLEGNITLQEAVYILKRDTRHFAKRQLTWFRREKNVIFINKDEYQNEDKVLDYMLKLLKEKNIYES